MVKLCIFDMDGLLIDSERCMWSVSMKDAASKQGFVMTQEFHNSYMGMNFVTVGDLLREKFGPNFDYDLFIKDTNEENKIIMEKGIPLRPGVSELLDYLKKNHIQMCIGTTTPRVTTEKILKIIGIYDLFDDIVCGDEVVNGKPNPEIYLKCLSKFEGIDKSQALVFEDGQSGGMAALASGMKLVLVPDLAKLDEQIRKDAYKVVNRIDEIIPVIEELNK